MKTLVLTALLCLLAPDELSELLDRLRRESPAELGKVAALAEHDPVSALRWLRRRFGTEPEAPSKGAPGPGKEGAPSKSPGEKGSKAPQRLPSRLERFTRIETLEVGEFSVDLCRREDGAFGLGEIRRGTLPLRRADFLVTWRIAGRFPAFESRAGPVVKLREPAATLTLAPFAIACAGARFVGFRARLESAAGPVVETASWELGGSTRGLSYFDGYRGWHEPPSWSRADAVPETNPKLRPSLLHGTGFQFLHGPTGALATFHASPGDRLVSRSRGEALETETTWAGPGAPSSIERTVVLAEGGSRINLWTRAFEVAHADIRRALSLPEPAREAVCWWPTFARSSFRAVAERCPASTEADGFTAVLLDNVFDNVEFHGGGKNLNTWSYDVCEGYGGEAGLRALAEECRRHRLAVHAWVPTGHLSRDAPMWAEHPDWVLRGESGEPWVSPSGGYAGDLDSGFRDHFLDRVGGVVRGFGLSGLWFDTHLPYAGQPLHAPRGARVAESYAALARAGARTLRVEGDASALAGYATLAFERLPEDPDLFYGSAMPGTCAEAADVRRLFRRYAASGAMWAVPWDFLHNSKVTGPEVAAARREIVAVLADWRRARDLMAHRTVHEDGSGYTWTNDRDARRCVWLLRDAALPDGRRGEAGKVYVIE
ncbi:MAG: hypothetical protein L0216_19050 [Planctomycetales bacterium]|nr:hypothetical protein [Planctomycetales bacterium]